MVLPINPLKWHFITSEKREGQRNNFEFDLGSTKSGPFKSRYATRKMPQVFLWGKRLQRKHNTNSKP